MLPNHKYVKKLILIFFKRNDVNKLLLTVAFFDHQKALCVHNVNKHLHQTIK